LFSRKLKDNEQYDKMEKTSVDAFKELLAECPDLRKQAIAKLVKMLKETSKQVSKSHTRTGTEKRVL
jgi:hypothetical protein